MELCKAACVNRLSYELAGLDGVDIWHSAIFPPFGT